VGSASIFWHAAGYGQEDEPGLAEHFGIATAEAMMAGCVPVVIRKGAQPEIVEHGISGFLWENEEELVAYTHQLMNSPELLQRMSRAARERALRLFSRERFVENFANLLRPHVPNLQM
jgi:glycosyltransferase involved in cell wall biosynthesis